MRRSRTASRRAILCRSLPPTKRRTGETTFPEATFPEATLPATTRPPGSLPAHRRPRPRRSPRSGGGELERRSRLVGGAQHDRPTPDPLQIIEHLAAALEVEPTPIDGRVMDQLESPVVTNVRGRDGRRAEVVLRGEQRLMERCELGVEHFDLPVAAGAVAKEIQLFRELARQIVAHEAEVIVLLHDVTGLLEPVALDDLFPHSETEMVGIDAERHLLLGRHRAHDIGVTLDRVEIGLLRHEVRLAQQPRVPVGGPALIHDLRGEYGIEIERLLTHCEEDVALPTLHLGRVVRYEPQQVTLRMRRHRGAFADLDPGAGGRGIERGEAAAEGIVGEDLGVFGVFRVTLTSQLLIDVDMLLECERRIERRLDALRAMRLDRRLDLAGVIGSVLDDALAHLLLAAPEQQVVV